MSQLVLQEIDEDGAAMTLTAVDDAGGSDLAPNQGGDTILHFQNDSAGASIITISAQVTEKVDSSLGKVSKADVVINVPAGETRTAGFFAKRAFNNASGNLVLTYSGDETALSVGVFKIK